MRWSLPKKTFSFAMAFGLAIAMCCGPARGQVTDANETEAVDLHEQLNKVVSLEVDNPPLREFVLAIQQQVPLLNVVVEEAVQEIPIPRVKLQRVSAEAALGSLAQLTGRRVAVNISENESFMVVRVDNESAREMELTEVLNVCDWMSGGNHAVNPAWREQRLEQLMDAIKTGLELLESTPDQLKFSLHETTGLLFVRGQHREVELVQRIVSELQRDPHGRNRFGPGEGGGAGMGAAGGPGLGAAGGSPSVGGVMGGIGEPDGSRLPERNEGPLER
jgi:hypothetical protein